MVIIGYQGIGKSTLCKDDYRFVDLESSIFDKSDSGWYKSYISVAIYLSNCGYIVFVSSHISVQEELIKRYENGDISDLYEIYPSLELRDFWVNKLLKRYEDERTSKNYRAYINAKNSYNDSISVLMKNDIKNKICIDDENYDLSKILKERL